MIRLIFIFAGLLLVSQVLLAQTDLAKTASSVSEKAGQELAAKLRSLEPGENAQWSGTLKIRNRDDETISIPITAKTVTGTPTWKMIYETKATGATPPEKLVIVHAAARPNEYFHARGTGQAEPPRVDTRQAATTPLAGSDFWLTDLGLDFLHWPVQGLLKFEQPKMRKGRPCDVLESVQPNPAPGGYGRVVSFVDKETGGLIMAEGYDHTGKVLKEFSVRSFKKVEGQWQLQEMEIRNIKTDSRTRIEFDLERQK